MPGGAAAGGAAGAAPPGTTFLLVRHGATEHTVQRRFSGCTGRNPPLSELGERQAALLATRLAGLGGAGRPDSGDAAADLVVVSSPVLRARRTAEAVAAACAAPLQVESGLREIDFGQWEGRTLAEVRQGWPEELAAWRSGAAMAPPGGESVGDVAARVALVRQALAGRHPGAVLVLVSHLYPVRLSVLDAVAAPYASVHRMILEPTSISEIRTTAGGATDLIRYNDTAHLPG